MRHLGGDIKPDNAIEVGSERSADASKAGADLDCHLPTRRSSWSVEERLAHDDATCFEELVHVRCVITARSIDIKGGILTGPRVPVTPHAIGELGAIHAYPSRQAIDGMVPGARRRGPRSGSRNVAPVDAREPGFTAPRVSVIVPVRNRRDLLVALLGALEVQTFRDFEVVVVDDGSTDGSGEEAATWTLADRPVRVLRQSNSGAVSARQAGVAVAGGEILAFTDSDCTPSTRWLEVGASAIARGADMVHGKTKPARPLRPLERSVASDQEGLFPTCNVFYRRSVYEKHGGFTRDSARRLGFRVNERARGLGFGEDTLLGWRVKRSGAVVRYAPEAVVYHHVFGPDFRDSVNRYWMAAAFPALIADVPELRPTLLHHRVLFGQRNRLPAWVTVGALITRHPRLAALAAAWWALIRYRELRRTPSTIAERLTALPQEMVLDLVMSAALATGSIRECTVVL